MPFQNLQQISLKIHYTSPETFIKAVYYFKISPDARPAENAGFHWHSNKKPSQDKQL